MQTVTVKAFKQVAFNRSPLRNYLEWRRGHRLYAEAMRQGDMVMLLSKASNKIVFVLGFHRVGTQVVFDARVAVVDNGVFSWRMIREYGKQVGLNIVSHARLAETIKGFGPEHDYVAPEVAHRALRLVK